MTNYGVTNFRVTNYGVTNLRMTNYGILARSWRRFRRHRQRDREHRASTWP
jgi:hypothetical protein